AEGPNDGGWVRSERAKKTRNVGCRPFSSWGCPGQPIRLSEAHRLPKSAAYVSAPRHEVKPEAWKYQGFPGSGAAFSRFGADFCAIAADVRRSANRAPDPSRGARKWAARRPRHPQPQTIRCAQRSYRSSPADLPKSFPSKGKAARRRLPLADGTGAEASLRRRQLRGLGLGRRLLLALFENELVALASNFAQLVHDRAGSGRDKAAHDHVLLEPIERVGLAVDRGFGEHARGLLERGCGDERAGLQRRLRDPEDRVRLGLLLAFFACPRVDLVEF